MIDIIRHIAYNNIVAHSGFEMVIIMNLANV